MTLLEEIVDGASGDMPVATLLRRLKVLASRTGGLPLGEWVDRELGGYTSEQDVPAYRGPLDAVVEADFIGVGRRITGLQIPPMTVPEAQRSGLFTVSIANPVAELEQWATLTKINSSWSPDVVRWYDWAVKTGKVQRVVEQDFVMVAASRPVMASVFVGILSAVRDQALNLALALEKVAPDAGQRDASPQQTTEAQHVINQTFNINGPSNLAVSSHDFTQQLTLPAQGDGDGLVRHLQASGLVDEQVAELRRRLHEDRAEAEAAGTPTRWERTRAWLSAAATDTTTGVVGGVVATAASAFLGS